jgi:hypothetical protein
VPANEKRGPRLYQPRKEEGPHCASHGKKRAKAVLRQQREEEFLGRTNAEKKKIQTLPANGRTEYV